jgi:lysophospholipase L1-like esterase
MQKYLFIGLGILVLVIVLAFIFKSEPKANKPTAGKNIIVFGDSLVYGVGAESGQDFVSLLAKETNTTIINAGKSGDTTATALGRLQEEVLQKDPKIVVIILGGNDILRRVPKAETLKNLRSIITQIQSQGAAVILGGVDSGFIVGNLSGDYKDLAIDLKTSFVPDILGGIIGKKDLMFDAIHPNSQGYKIMAEKFKNAVIELN